MNQRGSLLENPSFQHFPSAAAAFPPQQVFFSSISKKEALNSHKDPSTGPGNNHSKSRWIPAHNSTARSQEAVTWLPCRSKEHQSPCSQPAPNPPPPGLSQPDSEQHPEPLGCSGLLGAQPDGCRTRPHRRAGSLPRAGGRPAPGRKRPKRGNEETAAQPLRSGSSLPSP